MELQAPVDVFNGAQLVSFPSGRVRVDPEDLGMLLAGTEALPVEARMQLLGDVAVALQRAVASAAGDQDVASSMPPSRLASWAASLSGRSDPTTSSP